MKFLPYLRLAALVLLSLASLAYAVSPQPADYGLVGAAVPAGIGLGAGILALAFMAAWATQSESIKAWVRAEAGELALAAIIAVVVAGLMSSSGSQMFFNALGVADGSAPATISTIHTTLDQPLSSGLDWLVRNNMRLTKIVSYNYNYQYGIPWIAPTTSSSPNYGANGLINQMTVSTDQVSLALFLVRAVEVLFFYLQYAMFIFFIPAGILLRFIPPMRKAGGLFLAIGLSVYFVFPVSVDYASKLIKATGLTSQRLPGDFDDHNIPLRWLVCNPYVSDILGPGETIASLPPAAIISATAAAACGPGWLGCFFMYLGGPGNPPIVNPFTDRVWAGVENTMWWGDLAFTAGESVALEFAGLNESTDKILSQYDLLMKQVLPVVGGAVLAALLMLILVFSATILMAKNLAQVLGADSQFYGLTKLI